MTLLLPGFSADSGRASSAAVKACGKFSCKQEEGGPQAAFGTGEAGYFGRLSMTRLALPIERSMAFWPTTRTWVDTPM